MMTDGRSVVVFAAPVLEPGRCRPMTDTDTTRESRIEAKLAVECRDCLAQGYSTGECSCPPCPPLAELDIPYGDEDGEVAWFLKGERTPARTAAKKRARYDLDMDLDWIDFRVRTVYMRPSWRSWWGYTPSWGVEKCDRSDPEALPFWEVTHATR